MSVHKFCINNEQEIKYMKKFLSSLITNIIENDPFPNIKQIMFSDAYCEYSTEFFISLNEFMIR